MQRKVSALMFSFVVLLFIITGCNKTKEEYYGRPGWLEPPIYQQLKDKGNFTNYLACVDKAHFTNQLNGSGYYTVFAPTDEAFELYMSENGYNSVNDIDSVLAKKLVTYSMCVTPASYEQIDDFQDGTSTATLESTSNKAFKRTTYYSKWVYQETDVNGEEKYVIDINSSTGVAGSSSKRFSVDDFNQKNIPFFTSAYMMQRGISASDYNYFYPNTELTDFNVVDAKVIEKDLWAENGIIHIVDKVIPPLSNLEEILSETDNCSEFKNILDKYIVQYAYAFEEFQLKYEQASGKRQDIYIKAYDGTCFAPNCENYLSYLEDSKQMDAQLEGYTLFAPTNKAMQDFYNDKFFKYGYNSLDQMPDYIIQEFVNAHMFMTSVWPTRFDITTNLYGEQARFNAYSDVVKKVIGSNGIFYAVDKVQATNAFSTVLSDVLLNPDYSLMYQALLDVEPLAENLKSTTAKYLLFLISNDQFGEAGFRYNSNSNAWEFNSNTDRPDLGTSPMTALTRMINLHLVLLNKDESFDIMEGNGVFKTYNDEYVRFFKGSIFGSGNDPAKRPRVDELIESGAVNGQSHALSNAILFSNGNIGEVLSVTSTNKAIKSTQMMAYLKKIATATYDNEGVETFVSSCVYNVSSQAIKDISNTIDITVFLPSDEALAKAVQDGVLKSIGDFANGALGSDVLAKDNQTLENFIKYHIIKSNIVVGDVLDNHLSTYRKLDDGTYAQLHIVGDNGTNPGTLQVIDNKGRTANIVTSAPTAYNILGNRAIVHVIDNYLSY